MSLGARATKGGAKGKDRHAQDKGKSDKPQPKEKVKPQATIEQLRMANMIDRKADDTADVRKMVQDLMEMTCRTEEEVCSALHDADNDVVAACNLLLETDATVTGEWQTSEKKKKKPPPPTNNGEAEPPREPRSRSGPRPRRGEGERGERGDGVPRGRGSGRGGRGAGRGGRGGARGGRGGRPPRSDRSHDWVSHGNSNDANPMGDTFPATEDWDNEEWSGSLSDTKVFTPSVNPLSALDAEPNPLPPTEDWDAPDPPVVSESHIPTYTYHNPAAHHVNLEQQLNSGSPPSESPHGPPDAFMHAHTHHHAHTHKHHAQVQPMGMSGSLTAAQSQYLSQLTQQSQRHETSVYAASYGVYGAADIAAQRKPQRARVPPPSKIPSSAVEMPGGAGAEGTGFLDVQFGALDELPDPPKPNVIAASVPSPLPPSEPTPTLPAPAVTSPSPHQPPSAPHHYSNTPTMLSELSVEPSAASQPPPSEPLITNAAASLEKQLSASMKQLSVAQSEPAPHHRHPLQQHRPKQQPSVTGASPLVASATVSATVPSATPAATATATATATASQQNMYTHHVSHHPPAVYSANVYAPQVNSSNTASLSASAGAMPQPYPSSGHLAQYQPVLNSYQTSSTAAAYNSSALYTAAAYSPYQPPSVPKQSKDNSHQYDASAVASNNSLSSTSTTQTSTAKVTTTSGHVPSTANSSTSGSTGASQSQSQSQSQGYAGGTLYGASQYAPYDEQMLRSTMPHHMAGYYEVTGYGARDGTFGLGAGDRFGRTDAASPQQVPTAAALPPGYAYYYQPPPPTTYQYGVYPFGAGSNVGGVGGVGGVSAQGKVGTYPQQQQPPYDAQDSYKPGGGYTGSGSKAGGAAADLSNHAMYAKTHVTLNKVNSYEKAGFHSGTPPPFGAASHLYIAAPPIHHHHQPQQHQQESASSGPRSNSNKPAHSKPTYSHSYWPPN